MTDHERAIDNTQRLLNVQRAIRAEKIHLRPEDQTILKEVMAINLAPGELLKEDGLSIEALALVRGLASALRMMRTEVKPAAPEPGIHELQLELFEIFGEIFAAFAGISYDRVPSKEALREVVAKRFASESKQAFKAFQSASGKLVNFYQKHGAALFTHARRLGGLKLVLGGQRTFGPSALAGLRKMALYVDTQLVPDPIHPFFEAENHHRSMYVEILENLHTILQLKPLVDATLPVPPILVFPSFEKSLEASDVVTQHGIQQLILQVLKTTCNAKLETQDDLKEYLLRKPDVFIAEAMAAKLFVPLGTLPGDIENVGLAMERHLTELKAIRSEAMMAKLNQLSPAELIAVTIGERLAPQYHLLENGDALQAQPLLTQPVHWHFFERCAKASAIELNRQDIISADGLNTIRAMQETDLRWLANVPIPALVEMLRNQENLAFRKQLGQHTETLFSTDSHDIDRVVKEVSHGIESMIQNHQKDIAEIEQKYQPKYAKTWVTGGAGVAIGSAATFLPALAVFGPVAPIVAGAAMAGKLALDWVDKRAELNRVRRSMLGVLAATPRK